MKHAVDVHVGKRIRHQRWMTGITQQQLAEAVGVNFQQIQKYEAGTIRVSASRLWDIAGALNVPLLVFFEGLNVETPAFAEKSETPNDILRDTGALALVKLYYTIPEKKRRSLFDLTRSLGKVA